MYNSEIKARFMDSLSEISKTYTISGIFGKSEKFEERFNKDIAQFSDIEAKEFVDSLDIEELSIVYSMRSAFGNYIEWCKENKVFDYVSGEVLKNLATDLDISQRVARIAFRDENDLVFSMRKTREFDNGYIAPVVFSLAWVGLLRNEIYELMDTDVDLDNGFVNGFSIPPSILAVLRDYSECREGIRENNVTTFHVYKDFTSRKFIKPFRAGNSIRRGTEYSQRRLETMMAEFNERYISLGYPARFTFDNVWKSGRYRELWELESSGVDVFDKKNEGLVRELFRQKKNYAGILWYYKSYKKAFNL